VREAERIRIERQDTKSNQASRRPCFIEDETQLVSTGSSGSARRAGSRRSRHRAAPGSLPHRRSNSPLARPDARLHLGIPSWPNHEGLARASGTEIAPYRYFDIGSGRIDLPAIEAAVGRAGEGDLFCCTAPVHNPTGADLTAGQRASLLATLADRGVMPLIDAAYYGLGDGLEPDLQTLRDAAASSPRALISVACSKSFGLYRERTGILFAICADGQERERVQGQMERISRTLVSMPPAHGAATVALVLTEPGLRTLWQEELEEMRGRMLGLRAELAGLVNIAPMLRGVDSERGIFKLLPLASDQIDALARDHAIHLAPSGRANLAGLKAGDAPRLAEALAAVG
jgi:aromatic-amino-acid transaminase